MKRVIFILLIFIFSFLYLNSQDLETEYLKSIAYFEGQNFTLEVYSNFILYLEKGLEEGTINKNSKFLEYSFTHTFTEPKYKNIILDIILSESKKNDLFGFPIEIVRYKDIDNDKTKFFMRADFEEYEKIQRETNEKVKEKLFTKPEQLYINLSRVTKEIVPKTMVNIHGDTQYKLAAVIINLYNFDNEIIDSEEPELKEYDQNLYIKYAKNTYTDKYVPYIETKFDNNKINNLIFFDYDYEIDAEAKEQLGLCEKRFLLQNVGSFLNEGRASFISGQSMDWYLLYSSYYKQIILFNTGVYHTADHIIHNGQRVKSVERIFIFTKE